MNSLEKSKLETLQKTDIFSTLSLEQLSLLANAATEITLPENQVFIREDEINDEVYIVCEGEVEVFRKNPDSESELQINTLSVGSAIGELSLLDNAPRSAFVRTIKPSRLLALSIKTVQQFRDDSDPNKNFIYFNIIEKLAKNVATNIRNTNDVIVNSLSQELITTKARISLSILVICICLAMSVYTVNLDLLKYIQAHTGLGTEIFLLIAMAIVATGVWNVRKAGYPLSLFGLTLKNWQASLKEAIIFSLPILGLILIGKWSLIELSPSWHNRSLFELFSMADLKSAYTKLVFLNFFSYLLFVPLQEFLVRGSLQGPLEEILSSPHKKLYAILISNTIFAVFHTHLSIILSLPVFILGAFWGWLYSRNRTLVGVIFSHWVVGIWAIFIVNIRPVG